LVVAEPGPRYTDDVPAHVEAALRGICLELPDAYEERAWKGTRWMVRGRTFAHVLGVERDSGSADVVLTFRAAADELEVLRNAGPPFRYMGWGRDAIGLTLGDTVDWDEVTELVTESYCVLAPKKLVAKVDRPPLEDA